MNDPVKKSWRTNEGGAAVVSLPFARPVFEVGTALGRDWLVVMALAMVPDTLVGGAKWLPRRQGVAAGVDAVASRTAVSRASLSLASM